jgi:hypothetical protein
MTNESVTNKTVAILVVVVLGETLKELFGQKLQG